MYLLNPENQFLSELMGVKIDDNTESLVTHNFILRRIIKTHFSLPLDPVQAVWKQLAERCQEVQELKWNPTEYKPFVIKYVESYLSKPIKHWIQ